MRIGELRREDLPAARALLEAACPLDPAGAVAEEKLFGRSPPPLVGQALGAWTDEGRLAGVAAWAARWVRLLAVHPDEQGKRIGSTLLDEVMIRARAGGATRLRIGDQPGNYLAPGIDERNEAMLEFLERRGFRWVGAAENLAVPLVDNPLLDAAALSPEGGRPVAGYEIIRPGPALAGALLACAHSFSPAWEFEVGRALMRRPAGVHIAVPKGTGAADAPTTVAAFAAHDGNNAGLGWFGPAGTLEAHRGRGLGAELLRRCLADIAAAGLPRAVIAWIGPREFYEKSVGAVSDRRFVLMERAL